MPTTKKHVRIKVSQIKELARIHATEQEAAAVLGISVRTFREALRIDKVAREAWEFGRAEGNVGLRRKQYRLADTNPSMAIFLGKQWLGQNDVTVTEISGRDGRPVETMDLAKLTPDQRKNLRSILLAAKKK